MVTLDLDYVLSKFRKVVLRVNCSIVPGKTLGVCLARYYYNFYFHNDLHGIFVG